MSPEASARVGTTANRATAAIRQFGYYYEHDRFGRLILKQLPGCDPVYLVYDKRDRLELARTGSSGRRAPTSGAIPFMTGGTEWWRRARS